MRLYLKDQSVTIDKGELVSYRVKETEYMHQKGSPGWRNVDTEMFPIIGPTADAGFQVQTPREIAIQDQHGLLRELEYQLEQQTNLSATYSKSYQQRTPIKNSKYPKKSTQKLLLWPYNFKFEKKFELKPSGLHITFTISGEKDSPFMFGYHPAFRLITKNPTVIANNKVITLHQVLETGSKALQVSNCNTLVLQDKNELVVVTSGFDNFMLWTEVSNMICIEPITFYPYNVKQQNLDEGFTFLKDTKAVFSVHLAVNS